MNPEKLSGILRVDASEAFSYISALTYTYPDVIKVVELYASVKKLNPNLEPGEKRLRLPNLDQVSSDEVFADSLSRTKSKVWDYGICNAWELFVTFTFDPKRVDRYNVDGCKRKIATWIKNQQKRNGKFEYLIVPEYHKDGALHFHALIKGYPGKLKEAINPHTGKPLKDKGKQVYTLPGYRLGFTNVKKIDGTLEDRRRTVGYVSKYITKDMPRLFGKNRYWASHGLKLPGKEYGVPEWYIDREPMHVINTINARVSFFRREQEGD